MRKIISYSKGVDRVFTGADIATVLETLPGDNAAKAAKSIRELENRYCAYSNEDFDVLSWGLAVIRDHGIDSDTLPHRILK